MVALRPCTPICLFKILFRVHVPREFFTDIFFALIIYFYLLNQASCNLSTGCKWLQQTYRFYHVATSLLKIGYSRICACTKIPVFCLPPGPADENKGSRPSLIALQTELLLLYLNGVRRSELVAPNSNSSSSGAD